MVKNSSGAILLPIAYGITVLIPFPRGICPKVGVIAPVEFELAYFDIAVLHVYHQKMGVSSWCNG